MSSQRYTPEFKDEAAVLTRQQGVGCRQVALEIGINPNLLTRWRREANAGRLASGLVLCALKRPDPNRT